jgi:serine/threonine protein kinase
MVAKGGSCSVYRLSSFEGRGERCIKLYETGTTRDHLALLDLMRCPRGINVPMVFKWSVDSQDSQWSIDHTVVDGILLKEKRLKHSGLMIEEEWIEGKTLRDLMTSTPRTVVAHAGKWALQLGTTLMRLHDHYGFAHHDLKPENVMIDMFGDAVLIDFDAARRLDHSGTGRDALIGTHGYASPEMLLYPDRCDQRTDIYGFGRLFMEIIALEPHAFSPAVHEVFKKCARLDPDARFERAEHLLEALRFVFP